MTTSNSLPQWPAFEKSTAPFWSLYREVIDRLKIHAAALPAASEREWLLYLIENFEVQYRAWEWKPELRTCLERVDQHASKARLRNPLLIIGHAYLHVGYDLPRVIADSLLALSIDRRRAHAIFQDLAPAFREVFQSSVGKPETLGGWHRLWSAFERLIPSRKLSEIVAFAATWILYLRSRAWSSAINLTDSGSRRSRLEYGILQMMEIHSRHAMALSTNPLAWMNHLDPPDPFQFDQFAELPEVRDPRLTRDPD